MLILENRLSRLYRIPLTKAAHKTERIHSLDALRAIMMLLGLVLHSAMTYLDFPTEAWSLKDPRTTQLFSDFLVFYIHAFRMPVFFFVAGFFGALLFYERNPRRMIKNRVARIVFPLIVFLFLLYPVTKFSFGYTSAVFAGQKNPMQSVLGTFSDLSSLLPDKTFHLWFLYYLVLITAITITIGYILKAMSPLTRTIKARYHCIVRNALIRVLFLAGIIYTLLSFFGTAMVDASVSFIPDRNTLIYFWFFYLMGWLLFTSKDCFVYLRQYDWVSVILATILIAVEGLLILNWGLAPNGDTPILVMLSSLTVSLFLFGITGLFIRYYSSYSLRMRYLSDASYWVYLVHLPLTALLPAFVVNLPLPAFGKFLLVLSGTTVICFVSYHFLVRDTFIGQFLNGKRYARKSNPPLHPR